MKNFYVLILIFFLSSTASEAYIGPGMGAGTIVIILGLIGSIFLAIFAIVYYPIKRLLKKFKQKKPNRKIE